MRYCQLNAWDKAMQVRRSKDAVGPHWQRMNVLL
jgi:hypothetical protein